VGRLLAAFERWFSSAAGVWQTFGITTAIVLLEATGVIPDSHGFWLLYWLTVYSAVTQPALALSGKESVDRITALEERILEMEQRILEAVRVPPLGQ